MNVREFIKGTIQKFPASYKYFKNIYRFFKPIEIKKNNEIIQNQIEQRLGDKASLFFVQVGSNDGKQGDPLHKLIKSNTNWRGIFIEPVKFVFDRLVKNYHNNERFIFENVAIGEKEGKTKFYYLDEKAETEIKGGLPWWHDQLGSFDKDHIQKHFDFDIQSYIVEEEIDCLRLDHILERHGVSELDLLHIDTEGFDYNVLSQVNFEKYRPKCILFEIHHLSESQEQKSEKLLEKFGYKLERYGVDVLAVLPS